MITWFASLALAFFLEQGGHLHLFFLLIPVWVFATVTYLLLASVMGARAQYPESEPAEQAERVRKQQESEFLAESTGETDPGETQPVKTAVKASRLVSLLSLAACLGLALQVYRTGDLDTFQNWLILPTIIYFVSATYWIVAKEKQAEMNRTNS